jgi:hypothetical protein
MLSGFSAVFILSCLVLMGHQTHRTLGIEWLATSTLAAGVNTYGYVRGLGSKGSRYAMSTVRIAGGSACYAGQIAGSLLFLVGTTAGIYVSAIALVANFYFLISGSWLLIVGTLRKST